MKVALYFDENGEQIVLTPQTTMEKQILGRLHEGGRELVLRKGEFYACRGGWIRHGEGDESTILCLTAPSAGAA